jgi:hypothetical protein
MDPEAQKQIVDQITAQITASLQLQQQEQMAKMQEQLDKMQQLLDKKSQESLSDGGDASKTPKSYNRTSFDYGGSSKNNNPTVPMINLGKPPLFDGIRYTDWAHRMKLHLITARCWKVVDVGVNPPPQNSSEWSPKDERDFHLNATATTLIFTMPHFGRQQQG